MSAWEIREMAGDTHVLTCLLIAPPRPLYETLINLDVKNPAARYTSEADAAKGHREIVERLTPRP